MTRTRQLLLCGTTLLAGSAALDAGLQAPALPTAPTDATRAAQAEVRRSLPLDDPLHFANARRGFVATVDGPVPAQGGGVAFDPSAFAFLDGPAPDTANPSLWRQGQLNRLHGLFEVAPGLWQVRGLDLANMSVVRGATGWIVIDPLGSNETARAGLALVATHLGDRPVSAVIYTHSHADHYGGAGGVTTIEAVRAGRVPVIAPDGFVGAVVAESLLGGPHMGRRARYMFGPLLPRSATGNIGAGLGQGPGGGTSSFIPPTSLVTRTGERRTVDGVEFVFLLTPDAEAPSEMMFYLPAFKAFCQAEDINHVQHNLYTLRGTKVRNGLLWSRYIHDAVETYGGEVAVSFGSHHWPTWGNDAVVALWKRQRDLYRYLHDQTLRLANSGATMNEAAEELDVTTSVLNDFANRGYYGTVSHNVKAQYQLYFGWFDGNPANLHPLPPVDAARRYVEAMGGAAAVLAQGREAHARGDDRWAATVLNHLVFAQPESADARLALAEVYDQLGYRAESGPWRNFYLTGALELRNGGPPAPTARTAGAAALRTVPLDDLLDAMAVRLNGPLAARQTSTVALALTDTGERAALYLANGALSHTIGKTPADAQVTVSLSRDALVDLIAGVRTLAAVEGAAQARVEGNRQSWVDLLGWLEQPAASFNIVTP